MKLRLTTRSTIQGAFVTITGNYIDGMFSQGSGELLELHSSNDGSVFASFNAGTPADIDAAVSAASLAFETWQNTSVVERTTLMRAIADGIEARTDEFAELSTREAGTPLGISKAVQVGLALQVLRTTADAMDALELEEEIDNFVVYREPVGVVGAITPWNFPLHQIVAKLAPALAAGCTIVVKPAEISTASAVELFKVMDAVGVPAGVVNLVSGQGSVVGEALVAHPLVDMISFTGSTGAGKRIGAIAINDIKKVSLELGGKSATVLLADADLAKAVPAALSGCYTNNGQTCSALTRLIVLKSQQEEVERLLVEAVSKMVCGDPFEAETRIGPMASARQQATVRDYIQIGLDEGARLLAGGLEKPREVGFYVAPTIFTDVTQDMRIAQEEIFGPVLVVIPVDSEEDAIAAANNSEYGLSGAVWSADQSKAIAAARKFRTGQVAVNGGAFNARAPFGGYKKSGNGRELGKHGLEEFFELKAVRL